MLIELRGRVRSSSISAATLAGCPCPTCIAVPHLQATSWQNEKPKTHCHVWQKTQWLHCAVYLVQRSTLQEAADSCYFFFFSTWWISAFFFVQWVLWKDINSISITVAFRTASNHCHCLLTADRNQSRWQATDSNLKTRVKGFEWMFYFSISFLKRPTTTV